MKKGDIDADHRGLLMEAYRIEGITAPDCRSIFLDWALGLPEGAAGTAIRAALDHYATRHPDHPMTAVLSEGLKGAEAPRRRRGHAGRTPKPDGDS